ncbi:MAG: translocation/assembly module TamB domain-containing protein [Bryobacterales bacterium]|nr:translocation/assembly module TamB domain-containing protein [Bryobacterales bacterium]
MNRPARIALWAGAGLAALIGLAAIGGYLLLRSDWLREQVRRRIVAEVEKASGGKAEIGSFQFDWTTGQASVRRFVLHGTEASSEAPLFQARSVEVGLKIVSAFGRRVNIASLVVDQPRVNILVAADGTTNFPSPKTPKSGKDPVQTLLDLAVGDFQVRDGIINYDSRRTPIAIRGSDLNVKLLYDARTPRYSGGVSFGRVRVEAPPIEPLEVSARVEVALEPNRLMVPAASLRMKESEVVLSGSVNGFHHPEGNFDVQARLAMAELAPRLRLPVEKRGTVVVTGKASFNQALEYAFNGKVSATGLGISKGVTIRNIGFRGEFSLDPKQLDLKGLTVSAAAGSFTGAGRIEAFDRFRVQGNIRGFSLQKLAEAAHRGQFAWYGTVAGPVKVEGRLRRDTDLVAEAHLSITPAPGPMPVEGQADVRYVARGERIELGHSWVRSPNSRVSVSGTLGQTLEIQAHSSDLDDFRPVIAMTSPNSPAQLPVKLHNGFFDFSGTVAGPLRDPAIEGRATVSGFEVEGRKIDRLEAVFRAGAHGVEARSFTLARGGMIVKGSLDLGLENWKPVETGRLSTSFTVENADLGALLAEAGERLPIRGIATARVEASGSLGLPEGKASLMVNRPELYGQHLDRIQADFVLARSTLLLRNGKLAKGKAAVAFSASYDYSGRNWRSGRARFEVSSNRFALGDLEAVRDWRPDVNGAVTFRVHGVTRVENLKPELAHLSGHAGLDGITVKKWQAGDLQVDARTDGEMLTVLARANLEGSQPVEAAASIRLSGDYPTSGQVKLPLLNFATINHFRQATGASASLPFSGLIEGGATFSGPLRKTGGLTGQISLAKVQMSPIEQGKLANSAVRRDLSLTNNGPVEVTVDAKGAHIQRAEFTARDTKIAASGTVGFNRDTAWDLRLEGALNLAIIRSFDPNLRSEGNSTFNFAIRGPLSKPEMSGEMQLKNASFNYADLPNGIADANGTLIFDRNHATISRLTGHSGGGEVGLSGFIGFGGGAMLYRLAARATNVRVRYPEGTSTTVNAALNLTGNSQQSLLSGTVTIERAGLMPSTDVGGLLAAAQPVSTPAAPNEALRNMQLDIRIQTSANAEFATSYTQDIRAETDLRLRGTAARPSLMGRINILRGELLFFGNHYTINRGDISFYNPTRIEPVLDLNLQTDVRGITVTINFSGTLQRLNMTYRSDPPMQTQEIIALLAVGRAPAAGGGLASGQTVTNSSMLSTGANTLLGQAIATPVSSRLQRFFGVSRLKIDPLLQGTSVDATPQARLTLEQQISPNVTLTYVTSVAESQQQLVRLQWDINRQWSVVAIRDENGIFGIDFQYKRRF